MEKLAIIVPAAGQSLRFGGNKLMALLGGEPVVRRSVGAFLRRSDVQHVIIATSARLSEELSAVLPAASDQRLKFCLGGACRAQSVLRALEEVPPDVEWVLVHDAARPLISQPLIDATLAAALEHGAAVPALPVTLTVKEANGPLPARVIRTVPRQSLWGMQTPQVVRRSALLRAFGTCPIPLEDVTDDVQLIELAGDAVWLVAGEERNLKITTATDLKLAEMLLRDGGAIAL